jgi:hypothetical protein
VPAFFHSLTPRGARGHRAEPAAMP